MAASAVSRVGIVVVATVGLPQQPHSRSQKLTAAGAVRRFEAACREPPHGRRLTDNDRVAVADVDSAPPSGFLPGALAGLPRRLPRGLFGLRFRRLLRGLFGRLGGLLRRRLALAAAPGGFFRDRASPAARAAG